MKKFSILFSTLCFFLSCSQSLENSQKVSNFYTVKGDEPFPLADLFSADIGVSNIDLIYKQNKKLFKIISLEDCSTEKIDCSTRNGFIKSSNGAGYLFIGKKGDKILLSHSPSNP
ncbi:hypothetical protein FNH22_21050 [Fulvivirga sp. M361]|uniref:hypothetical protein n=1 Tax=Fulvivirga sp. M361 TaxID=2594266 RepID=UPI00117B9B44|nr:hypothetical protein [Fulvivirga sp. M361]TRX53385.1 hypothetical protein FNH22_21050 [Fulvivirga sp. M361]